jgi:hypothetical protein
MRLTRITRVEIEKKLSNGAYFRYLRKTQTRQSWGGAGVVVQSPECDDRPEQNVPGTNVLRTPHAQAIGRLFRDISSWVSEAHGYDYFSKAWFWDQLIDEGIRAIALEPQITGPRLLARLWSRALAASERLGRSDTNN